MARVVVRFDPQRRRPSPSVRRTSPRLPEGGQLQAPDQTKTGAQQRKISIDGTFSFRDNMKVFLAGAVVVAPLSPFDPLAQTQAHKALRPRESRPPRPATMAHDTSLDQTRICGSVDRWFWSQGFERSSFDKGLSSFQTPLSTHKSFTVALIMIFRWRLCSLMLDLRDRVPISPAWPRVPQLSVDVGEAKPCFSEFGFAIINTRWTQGAEGYGWRRGLLEALSFGKWVDHEDGCRVAVTFRPYHISLLVPL
ncbi:hypothetical protein HDK64DRAFT_11277 [Phyllosticta capitalensis]